MNRSKIRPAMVLLTWFLLGPPLLVAQSTPDHPLVQVTVDSGPLRGAEVDGVVSFKGIPYAAPPIGELRWRDPQPVKPWKEVRPAVSFGASCMQPTGLPTATANWSSEDCLFLNVWRPASTARKLPVMVWIHGGAFVIGSSSSKLYDGTEFARHGVILVSLNYRLGRLGFFAHPALTAEQPHEVLANYAFMDQLAALQWVQRNIAAFGGDPKEVTVFGESAGGFSVQALMGSPMTKGLFVRAIVESGGGYVDKKRVGTKNEIPRAEAKGIAFAKLVKIEGTGKDALEKLRTLPAETIQNYMEDLLLADGPETDSFSGPVVDGKFSIGVPSEIFRNGGGQPVSLMIGSNSKDKGDAAADSKDELFARFGAQAADAKTAYDPGGTVDLRTLCEQVGGDQLMHGPARTVAKEYARRGLPTYEYRFSYIPLARRANVKGAAHAAELGFVFKTLRNAPAEDQAMSDAMISYWSAFAMTGDPHTEGLPVWPKYSAATDVLMDFTNAGPKSVPDPWKGRLDATEAVTKVAVQ